MRKIFPPRWSADLTDLSARSIFDLQALSTYRVKNAVVAPNRTKGVFRDAPKKLRRDAARRKEAGFTPAKFEDADSIDLILAVPSCETAPLQHAVILQLERCESQVIDMLVKVQYIINVIRAQ